MIIIMSEPEKRAHHARCLNSSGRKMQFANHGLVYIGFKGDDMRCEGIGILRSQLKTGL